MGYKNQSDQNACARRHYARNKEVVKARSARNRRATVLLVRRFLEEYKNKHPCVDCLEADPVVLEFDHRDPKTKKFDIGTARSRGISLASVQKEVEKCDVRCANCHRRKHARLRQVALKNILFV